MKVFNSEGVHIKTIPEKFAEVAEGYAWLTEGKRLNRIERFALIKRLARKYFTKTPNCGAQFELACDTVKSSEILHIRKVIKRGGISDWRVVANNIEFRIPEWIVSDCPKGLYIEKHEF